MSLLAWISALLTLIGLAQAAFGWREVRRFATQPRHKPSERPPVTILKPLHGDEPLLEDALASFCRQDYPTWQVIFGVQSAADPALAAVRRVQQRCPDCDIAVVIDPTLHGANHKVGNLINMLSEAKYDVLAITDSDLHVAPDYLDRIVTPLGLPGTGLVCTLYAGLPATRRLPGLFGASHITHSFLPGALLARVLGRQDSLGATMLLRRATLQRIGGLEALVDHLADDNALGRLVREIGLAIRLTDTVPLTTVPETRLIDLFRHELRWARTIRALVPLHFVASALQYPLAWAALTILLSGGAAWSLLLFAATWTLRDGIARRIDRALGVPTDLPIWLLPMRDLMSVAVMIASYGGLQVDWRGHELTADGPAQLPPHAAYAEPKGLSPQ